MFASVGQTDLRWHAYLTQPLKALMTSIDLEAWLGDRSYARNAGRSDALNGTKCDTESYMILH